MYNNGQNFSTLARSSTICAYGVKFIIILLCLCRLWIGAGGIIEKLARNLHRDVNLWQVGTDLRRHRPTHSLNAV